MDYHWSDCPSISDRVYDDLLSRVKPHLYWLASVGSRITKSYPEERSKCIRSIAKEILRTGEIVECHGPTKGELARFRREDYEQRVRDLEKKQESLYEECAAAINKKKGWFSR